MNEKNLPNIIEDYIVNPSKIMSLYHNPTQVDLDNQDNLDKGMVHVEKRCQSFIG